MGQDGGMHPSFVAKLNPQHVRDDKGNVRWLVDNPPIGTAKAAVHPIRETDAAPVMAAAAPSPAAESVVTASGADVPMPRANPRRAPAVASSQPTSSGSMFSGLFAGGTSTVTSSFSNATSTVVRALGFGKEDPKPEATARAAMRPAPKPAAGANAATPATVAAAERSRDALKPDALRRTADATPPTMTAEASPQATAAEATPPANPAAGASLMTGAQPTLPAGSFDGRFNAFR
jgi:hypothetical protein